MHLVVIDENSSLINYNLEFVFTSFLPMIRIEYPSLASLLAMAKPIPSDPPVTRAHVSGDLSWLSVHIAFKRVCLHISLRKQAALYSR